MALMQNSFTTWCKSLRAPEWVREQLGWRVAWPGHQKLSHVADLEAVPKLQHTTGSEMCQRSRCCCWGGEIASPLGISALWSLFSEKEGKDNTLIWMTPHCSAQQLLPAWCLTSDPTCSVLTAEYFCFNYAAPLGNSSVLLLFLSLGGRRKLYLLCVCCFLEFWLSQGVRLPFSENQDTNG